MHVIRNYWHFNKSIWPIGMFPYESTTGQAANRDEYRGCSSVCHPRRIAATLWCFFLVTTAAITTKPYNNLTESWRPDLNHYKILHKTIKRFDEVLHYNRFTSVCLVFLNVQ